MAPSCTSSFGPSRTAVRDVSLEEVQDAREDYDEYEGLEALHERPWFYLREGDAADRDGKHQSVGQPVHGREEGGDVDDDEQQLGARVEPVDDGVPGEVLAQGYVLEHQSRPPFLSRASTASCSCCAV